MQAQPLPSVTILGSHVHRVTNNEVVELMESWIQEVPRRCHFVVNTGFHGLWVAHQEPEFKAIVNSADVFTPDGIAPVWVSRIKRKPIRERSPGAELMKMYFERANEKGYRSFFLGDTEETLQALRENLENRYPGHRVVGTYSPPFRSLSTEEEVAMLATIEEAKPDVIWVGLGLPKQERWIHARRHTLNAAVAIGVGACFGFFSGKVKRSPPWVGRMGFEWLWRFSQEPRKLWRRVLWDGPRFVVHVVLELTGLRKYE